MPPLHSRHLSIALDMAGCPNHCRHCYLGWSHPHPMTEADLHWAAEQFRRYVAPGEDKPFASGLTVSSWFREPDFSPAYRELHALEAELSDGKPARYELLSIWRLAHDEGYARWAKGIGPDTCQISFFGVEATQDWFHRRKGAFRDCLLATERLLDTGLKPRWQLFLTRKLIPDLGKLLGLVEKLRLRQRVEALGGSFQLFVHTPAPDGEARHIEGLRPTLEEAAAVPRELIETSREYLHVEHLWYTEAELVEQMLAEAGAPPCAYDYPQDLWLLIRSDWDVFSNLATQEPWWRLGNLRTDGPAVILRRFIQDDTLGLRAMHTLSARDLALRYGDPSGQRVYSSRRDLEALYLARHCERIYRTGGENDW